MTTHTVQLQPVNQNGEPLVEGMCGERSGRAASDCIEVSGNSVIAYIKKPGQGIPYCFFLNPEEGPTPGVHWEDWPGPELNSTFAKRWHTWGSAPTFSYQDPELPLHIVDPIYQNVSDVSITSGVLHLGCYCNDQFGFDNMLYMQGWDDLYETELLAKRYFSISISVSHGDNPVGEVSYVHVRIWSHDTSAWVSFYFYACGFTQEDLGEKEFIVSPGVLTFDLAEYGFTAPYKIGWVDIELAAEGTIDGETAWVSCAVDYIDFT